MNKDHFLYFLSIKIRMIDAAITEPIKIPRAISVIIHSPSPDHLLFLATLWGISRAPQPQFLYKNQLISINKIFYSVEKDYQRIIKELAKKLGIKEEELTTKPVSEIEKFVGDKASESKQLSKQ